MKKTVVTQQNLSLLEYLQQSPQELLQEELLSNIQEKKSEWEISIAKTKASLARSRKNLQDSFRKADISGIIKGTEEVDGYEKGLVILEAAFTQLFPTETVTA